MSETESATVTETIEPETEAVALPHARIRVGAVVWGLVVVAVAAATLWILTSAERRDAAVDAVGLVSPVGIGVVSLLTVGAAALLIAGTALVRRAQIRRGGSE